VPIVLRHNEKLEVSRVEYSGAVSAQDLRDHARFNVSNEVWLGFDCLSVIHREVEVAGISQADLDDVFRANRTLFEPLQLLFLRRSAWICESPPAQRFLSHWLTKRNAEKLPYADVRQFDTYEAVAEWFLLGPEGLAALKSGDSFREIARFETPARSR